MSSRRRSLAASVFLATAASLPIVMLACGGAKTSTIHCPDGDRVALLCDSEVSYQGIKAEGSAHVLNIASGSGSFADTALRDVNQDVERYVTTQTRLCREYNACVVSGETYHAEAAKARDHLAGIDKLVDRYNAAKSAPDRAKAADAIYARTSGKDEAPLSFRMTMQASIPPELGGGDVVVPPNMPLPTGARVAFTFETSRDAYLYIFQVNAQSKVAVLFPDDATGISNPIHGQSAQRIPRSKAFRLDENGVGVENVYIVASNKPLTELDATLKKFASGKVETIADDKLLAGFGKMPPGSAANQCGTRARDLKLDDADGATEPGCAKTRGLVLDDAPEPNKPVNHSLEARTATGDDTIVKVFPFQHVVPNDYRAKLGAYNAPTAEGQKTRGIVIEN